MKVLNGNEIHNIESQSLRHKLQEYDKVTVDIGTGDGSFPYKKASADKNQLFIGLDAVADNMKPMALKANKKSAKGGLPNVLYIVEDALNLPEELYGAADSICINLPWGSLRDAVVKGEEELLEGISKLAKNRARFDIYVTYSPLYEAREINNRDLPELSLEYIYSKLAKRYKALGIDIKKAELCDNERLKSLDTSWAKKLAYGRKRDIYHISGIVKKIN